MMRENVCLIISFCIWGYATLAAGRGILCYPRQRGTYDDSTCGDPLPEPAFPVPDFCPMCLNGGSKETTAMHLPPEGWKVYDPIGDFDKTATRAGLCGDRLGNDDHMIGGRYMPYRTIPKVATWVQGSEIDIFMQVGTNHNGYYEFYICNLDKCGTSDISAECFKNGHCKKLDRVSNPTCEMPDSSTIYSCGPIDSRHPSRFYLPCRLVTKFQPLGGDSGTMRYRLPTDMYCEHCVFQMYYVTANTCAPPDFLTYFTLNDFPFGLTCESDGGGRGGFRRGTLPCGGRAETMQEIRDRVPEEFWACADVTISRAAPSPSASPLISNPCGSPFCSSKKGTQKACKGLALCEVSACERIAGRSGKTFKCTLRKDILLDCPPIECGTKKAAKRACKNRPLCSVKTCSISRGDKKRVGFSCVGDT